VSTTSAAPTPGATGIGTKIKDFILTLGHDIGTFLPKLENDLAAAEKDIPTIAADINAGLAVFDPGLVLPAKGLEDLANLGVTTAKNTLATLTTGGVNPSSIQVAAVAYQSIASALKLTPTQMATALASSAPAPAATTTANTAA